MNWAPLFISLRAAVFATIFALITGTFAAWRIVKIKGPARSLVDGFLTLPLVLPPTVTGFFLLLIFGSHRPLGRFLVKAGLAVIFNWRATVVAASVVAFPLVYRTVRASFEQIDPSIINAARTLGLGEWRIFIRILIPVSGPGIAAGSILAFARAIGEFGATLMLAGDIPGHTETIPVAIWAAAEAGHMEQALLWVLIIVTISFVTILLMNLWDSRARGI
jgi:molybdate transport system permease protein